MSFNSVSSVPFYGNGLDTFVFNVRDVILFLRSFLSVSVYGSVKIIILLV